MTKCISSIIIEVVFLSFSIHSWIQPQQLVNGILQLKKFLIDCKAFSILVSDLADWELIVIWPSSIIVEALIILLWGSCNDQRLGNPTPRPNKVIHKRRVHFQSPFTWWGRARLCFSHRGTGVGNVAASRSRPGLLQGPDIRHSRAVTTSKSIVGNMKHSLKFTVTPS